MTGRLRNHWAATSKDRRNQRLIIAWSLAWIVPFLAATFAIESGRIATNGPAIVATATVTLLGVGVLLAYRRFLSEADELMRKIQLDALAVTVGVGYVSGFSYSLLETAGLVGEARAMNLIMVMVVTYIITVIIGQRRYA